MSWQDGGPLDPPELSEVDYEAVLADNPCGACERKDGWREEPKRNAHGDRVWRCTCGEDTMSESDILEHLAEEHAPDDAYERMRCEDFPMRRAGDDM